MIFCFFQKFFWSGNKREYAPEKLHALAPSFLKISDSGTPGKGVPLLIYLFYCILRIGGGYAFRSYTHI